MQLEDKYLVDYIGGFSFNATLVNAVVRGFSFILDLGKTIGTSLRRGLTGQACTF